MICGYDKCMRALHFHHIDPTTKLFHLAWKGKIPGLAKMRAEASKCILLCSNCHMEVEDGITMLSSTIGGATPC